MGNAARTFGAVILVFMSSAVAFVIGVYIAGVGQSDSPGDYVGIWAEKVIAEGFSAPTFAGDGTSMVLWAVEVSEEDIRTIVSPERIERGRIWFRGPFDERAEKGMAFLRNTIEYNAVRLPLERLLESEEYYYTYERYKIHLSDKLSGFRQGRPYPGTQLEVSRRPESRRRQRYKAGGPLCCLSAVGAIPGEADAPA